MTAEGRVMTAPWCANVDEHPDCTRAAWRVSYPDGEHDQALACDSCLDELIAYARSDRKALTFARVQS